MRGLTIACAPDADRVDVEGTPYAGGYFSVKFKFTEEFPAAPPKCACACLSS